jgi:hypothetical protein
MQQKSGDHCWPLGFFSHKLTDTESCYSTFDREILVCAGRAFQLWTDHKALVIAISRVSARISPRQQRHLAFISEFNVQLLYLPGLKNVVADILSCPIQTAAGSVAAMLAADPVDFEEMAAKQNCCPETQRLLGGTSLKLAFRQTGAQRLGGDVSTGNFCPVVPLKFRKTIFDHFHNVAHPGRLASRHIISSRFVWCSLFNDAPPGPSGVWPARGARSTATHAWSHNSSSSPNGVFLTSMLIWWALCSTVIVLIIFLLLFIVHPNGWKPSRF